MKTDKSAFIIIICLCLLCPVSSRAQLLGYWNFEDPAYICRDVSGNGNSGSTVGNVVLVSDAAVGNGAAMFDGSSYINLFSCESFKGDFRSGRATVAFWMKLNSGLPAASKTGLASIGCWAYPSKYPSALNKASLKFFLSNGSPLQVNLLQQAVLTKWHHFAITVNTQDTAAGYKVYQNGIQLASFPMNGQYGNFYPPDVPRIGVSFDVASHTFYYLDGKVDDIRIYNETLTPMQVRALYNPVELTGDAFVNASDLYRVAQHWLETCSGTDNCDYTDFNQSGTVDFQDLAAFSSYWLATVPK